MGNLRDEHDQAVDNLRKYVPGAGVTVLDLLLAGSGQIARESIDVTTSAKSSLTAEIQRSMLDLINGGKFTNELLESLETALRGATPEKIKEIARFVRITIPKSDADQLETNVKKAAINSANKYSNDPNVGDLTIYGIDDITPKAISIRDPKKDATPIVVYEFLNQHLGLNVRDTAPVSIGSSIMTPLAMSRCVPYLNARVFLNSGEGSNIDEAGKTNGFNLIHYLRGPTSPGDIGAGAPMVISLVNGVEQSAPGMELFTSPQTLVTHPDDIQNFSLGRRPIDRFRPLMSISSFSVQVSSGGAGMISTKSASMEIVLYDRGRLGEVAQLVKPGLYSKVQIEIEYGWSGITSSIKTDGSVNINSSADDLVRFMNTLRVKEKYQVTTSNYKFEENGSVSISLGLHMTGASDAIMVPIINDTAQDSAQAVKRAIEGINEIFFKNSKVKDVFGDTVVGAVSSIDYTLTLDPKAVQDLLKKVDAVKKQKTNQLSTPAAEVSSLLKKLYGNSEQSLVNQYKSSMKTAIKGKLDAIKAQKAQSVFQSGNEISSAPIASYVMKKAGNPYSGGNWVNFGSLVTTFVAEPIAATKKFDEIQLTFGRFNPRAGFMRNLSIASFPLDLGKLKTAMDKLVDSKVNVTPNEFIQSISDNFISNSSNFAYGFSDAFVKKDDGSLEFNTETGQQTQDKACEAAGILDKTIQIPGLRMYVEAVPHASKQGASILRIHFIDETCSTFSTYHDVLWSARESDSFFLESTNVSTKHPNFKQVSHPIEISPDYVGSERTKIIESLKEAGAIQTATSTSPATDPSAPTSIDVSQIFTCNDIIKVRDYFKRTLPSITYGAMNGMVNSIGVSSVSSPELAAINIVNMDQNDSNTSPNAARSSGLPLQVFPAEISIEMMGNPMLAYAQEYFIDIGTNTTMDNIYAVTGLDHKLEPGSFTTSLKMTLKPGLGLYQSQKRKIDKMAGILDTVSGQLKAEEQKKDSAAATAKKSQAKQAAKTGGNVSKADITIRKVKITGAELWKYADLLEAFRSHLNPPQTTFLYHEKGIGIWVEANIVGFYAYSNNNGQMGISYNSNDVMKTLNSIGGEGFNRIIWNGFIEGQHWVPIDMRWFVKKPTKSLIVTGYEMRQVSAEQAYWKPIKVELTLSFLKSISDPGGYIESGPYKDYSKYAREKPGRELIS